MQQRFLRSGRIHYRDIRRGDTTLLLVHGWMVSGRAWNRLLPLLPGFRLVVPDLAGSGRSKAVPVPASLDGHVDDLAALCEARGLCNVHLAGHSMGGQIAALLAARHPKYFSGLVLLNPVPVDGLPLPEELQRLFRNCGGDRESLDRILNMACLALPPEARAELLDDALEIAREGMRRGFDNWSAGQPGTNLASATMPVNVVATDDPFLPAAFLQQAIVNRMPRARLHHLPGTGHYPHVESPAATSALLRKLLS